MQDLTSDPKSVSFSRNGEELKEAFTISDSTERLYFPHVTTKNVCVSFNFGGQPPAHPPPEGYSFIQEAAEEDRDFAVTAATNKSDCEVILTVGLPASGKTYWASRQLSKYPEKRYTVIGICQLIDRMTVSKLYYCLYMYSCMHVYMYKLHKPAVCVHVQASQTFTKVIL